MIIGLLVLILLLQIKIAFFPKAVQINLAEPEIEITGVPTQFIESVSDLEKFNQANNISDLIKHV